MNSERLRKDIYYIRRGLVHHDILYTYFPPREGALILEPGCGSGKLGIRYAMHGLRVVLLDIDPAVMEYTLELIRAVEPKDARLPIVLCVGDIHDLPFGDNSFNLVFNEGVCEHWRGPARQRVIDEMVRVSSDTVIIFVPNALSAESRRLAETTAHAYKSMPPEETPYFPDELRGRMEKAGLKDVAVEPVFGDFQSSRQIVGVGKK